MKVDTTDETHQAGARLRRNTMRELGLRQPELGAMANAVFPGEGDVTLAAAQPRPAREGDLWSDTARDVIYSFRRLFVANYRIPFRCPTDQLRARVAYGGKKGRAALKRLKARGASPIVGAR